ncbi:MAG: type II toxin-antitoxin system VapC family toxin [Proteobacteria bacterium]|nr:type II toxin-antitoxin system VapC family toxin [Pseudomonadota bacterium]
MIVVDTNVIAYLWIPGLHTSQAESALRKDANWVAPLLWRSEFRNILTGYIRCNQISFDTVVQLMEEAEDHMNGREYTVSSAHVLSLVRKSSCSAYDCEFVALAEDLEVSLLTTDRKILSTFPSVAVSLGKFCS